MVPAVVYEKYVLEKYKPDYQSWYQQKDGPVLTRCAIDLFLNNYIPNEQDRGDPLFSDLLFPTGNSNLPPSYFQICGSDPLRDEALIFERILREDEGIKTKVDVYPGLRHGYWSVNPEMKASRQFVDDWVKGVEWLLGQQK
jgi:acetyl esterase/lipase